MNAVELLESAVIHLDNLPNEIKMTLSELLLLNNELDLKEGESRAKDIDLRRGIKELEEGGDIARIDIGVEGDFAQVQDGSRELLKEDKNLLGLYEDIEQVPTRTSHPRDIRTVRR